MKAFRALLLVLALSVCTYAGDMPNERSGIMPNEITGEIPNEYVCPIDPVTEITLHLLQSMFPLY